MDDTDEEIEEPDHADGQPSDITLTIQGDSYLPLLHQDHLAPLSPNLQLLSLPPSFQVRDPTLLVPR